MERSTLNRFGLASVLLATIAMPLCGCGNPDGVQENPYAAPAASSDGGSDTTVTDEAATESSSATE